jgi:DNA polymerase III alpha subunit (gram-positive type)
MSLFIKSGMSKNNKNTGICLYDIESTGLKVTTDSILEVCFIDYATQKTILHIYINPSNGKKIENSHIHKLDEKVLKEKNALDIKDALKKINTSLTAFYDKKLILLTAHNNFGFDQLILESEYYRAGIKPLKNIMYFDSLPFIRKYLDGLDSYGLGKLYEMVAGVEEEGNDQLHTAEYDTKCLYTVLARIFTILIKENKLAVDLGEFTRISIFDKKILDQPPTKLTGVRNGEFLKKKGLKNIKGFINIYKVSGFSDEFFTKYVKQTYKITRKSDLDKILRQIKTLYDIHNK